MNEEQDKLKNIGKGLLKLFLKKTIVIGVIVLVLIVLSGSMYVVKKEAFENASDTSQTYSGSVNGQGQTVVVKTEEDGTQTPATIDDIVDEVQPILEPYMDGSDEEKSREIIKTIIQAELITKQPYRDLVPEGETNGQIKFYRYTDAEDEVNADDIKEEKRLKYMPLADFKAKIEAYKSNAEANQDVFKYFTIDENQKVLIACGEEKHRKIITGVDGTEKDLDLTVDIINQESTANSTYSGTPASGFEAREYTIIEKTIDYLPLIEQYIMPSNLLYALLIQTEDEDFVKAIADLACGNEIAIGIYDNKTHSESTKTYTYKKLMKINVKTSLNYKDTLVSITDSQPAIEIKYNDLSSLPYEYIPIYCETQTIESENAEENGKINHMVIYKKEGDEPRTLHDDSMYINGTNYNNEITGLGEGKIFKTTYTITTDVTSTPTAGILLADTWVAKWEETYTKKSNNTPEEASPETDLENKEIATYTDDNSLYLAFSQNFRSSMAAKLSSHATELREEAIHRIIDATPESTYEAELENVTFDDTEKKAVLAEHLAECSECPTWVSNEGLTEDIDTIFSKITTSPTGELVNVKNHYEAKWNEYVEEKEAEAEQNAVNKTSERKAEFERQLHVPETISYNITLSGNKQYVNIKFSSSSSTNYSEYEKSGKIERTEEGVKFSNIFNAEEFHSARQMLFETEEWFWENIRENEDTAKLEDTLRYLLNKATNSTNYGTYTDEDVDDIFSAFEPKEMSTVDPTIYGNTVEAKLWFALCEKGYSPIAVAGVMGNIYAESGFKTNNLENSYESKLGYTDETYTKAINDGLYTREQFISDHNNKNCGAGYGLAQWTYYSRKAGLYDFAKSKGVCIDDENMQIEYLIGELTSSGGADGYASYNLSAYNGYTVDDWKNAESPEEAAVAFCWIFEKPGTPNMSTREEKAREYYEKYSNGGNYVQNTSGDERIIGSFTSSITGRTFTIFRQNKIEGWSWKCNRAAQISMCSGYWNGTNDQLIEACQVDAASASPAYKDLYEKCGLTYSVQASGLSEPFTFDSNKIKEQIQNGGYAIVYIRGENHKATGVSKYNRDWANKAHWVVILDYRELNTSGSIGQIFVSDSADRHVGWVPLDEFEGITDSVYFVNEK